MTMGLELLPHTVLVHGDELRLAQVVRNLLDNALRYTSPGGRSWWRLHHPPPGGGADVGDCPIVPLCVCDTDPDIPSDEADDAFERFHAMRAAC